MTTWMQNHTILLGWLGAASVFTFLATLIAVPWLVVRLDADYFTFARRHHQARQRSHPIVQLALVIFKNILGTVFIATGMLMLVLPGQGLLTIVIGLTFLDFPGKYQLERRLVSFRPVLRSINWLRQKAKREKLNLG
jgi:hypothetical protein